MTKDSVDRKSWKPIRLNNKKTLRSELKRLRLLGKVQINDQYKEMLEEWFLLKNPKFRFNPNYTGELAQFFQQHTKGEDLFESGQWFYYPWLGQVVHSLPEKMHQELRTGRNKNLITVSEQEKIYQARVVVLGMSVGSHVALTLAMTGAAKYLAIADPDVISGSNLNRIRTGLTSVGMSKVIAVARQIYEMNPYANVEIFPEGVTDKNLKKILLGKRKADLVIDEMDNPYFKFRAREIARSSHIPVIMAGDNADSSVVDIERFDRNHKTRLLHGIMGNKSARDLKNIPPQDLPSVMAKIAGGNLSTVRMLESVMEVGKSLYSWPQVGNAATLCGSVLTYIARQILIGAPMASGRFDVNIERFFRKPSKTEIKRRRKILKTMSIT